MKNVYIFINETMLLTDSSSIKYGFSIAVFFLCFGFLDRLKVTQTMLRRQESINFQYLFRLFIYYYFGTFSPPVPIVLPRPAFETLGAAFDAVSISHFPMPDSAHLSLKHATSGLSNENNVPNCYHN